MKKLFQIGLKAVVVLTPWPIKRRLLQKFWKYTLHPTAKIGLSWIYPEHLEMTAGSSIGHFNVAIHLDQMILKEHTSIGRGNWITGYPRGGQRHFLHQTNRSPSLFLGEHSAVTKNHHLDCTDRITIGPFTTLAGYHSQLLTHSIDVHECRQDSHPIEIGSHCFIGTNVVILGGSKLPDRSVLGAKALLNRAFQTPDCLYGGVPAKELAPLQGQRKYFVRNKGFVD
jgi:acetyltransferase-like isoleucine patch superfamily enzyme